MAAVLVSIKAAQSTANSAQDRTYVKSVHATFVFVSAAAHVPNSGPRLVQSRRARRVNVAQVQQNAVTIAV